MTNNNNSYGIFESIGTIIGASIFTGVCGWIFIKAADSISRIVIIPFIISGLAVLLKGIFSLLKGLKSIKVITTNTSDKNMNNMQDNLNKAINNFEKLYAIGFLLYWFGLLIVFDYFAIKQGELTALILSLIFWVIGIYVAKKKLFKTKKKE